MTYQDAAKKLKMYGQEHVLKYFDELSEGEKSELLEQIELTDFSVIEQGKSGKAAQKGVITPLASLELDEINENKARYTELGIKAIKEGKVAAVLLAGGMGTRLGSDDPKGMYNIGKTKDVYIFQRLIENLMDIVELVQTDIYMFVMTSDKNHAKTVNFFKEHNYFGYKEEYIKFLLDLNTKELDKILYLENDYIFFTIKEICEPKSIKIYNYSFDLNQEIYVYYRGKIVTLNSFYVFGMLSKDTANKIYEEYKKND